MSFSLSLRPRALAEVRAVRDHYASVGHGDGFIDALDTVFEAIAAMPRRFPIVHGTGAAHGYDGNAPNDTDGPIVVVDPT